MNILYIALDLNLPGYNGGSTHAQETIKSISKLGHNVIVLCKKESNQKSIEKNKTILYQRIKLPKSSISKNLFILTKMPIIIKNIIKKNKIDLVWERNRIFGGQGVFEAKKIGIKSLLELNEPIETSKNNIFFPIIFLFFKNAISNSSKVTGQHEIEFKHVPKVKQVWQTNGSNPEIFNPKKIRKNLKKRYNLQGKTLFYSGSFQNWHGLTQSVDAFEIIKKEFPTAAFILAGDGPQRKTIQKMVKEKKLKDVYFIGNISYSQLPFYINASEICLALFDRTYESIKKYGYFYSPVKVQDYKACGKPIIASNIGNLKKMIKDKKNGFLVNEQNPEQISKKIKILFKEKKLVRIIKQNNINDIIKRHNWILITKSILGELK